MCLLAAVLHGEASPATRAVLAAELESPEITRVTPYDRVAKDTDVEKLAAFHGVPFEHIPVTPATRAEAENAARDRKAAAIASS